MKYCVVKTTCCDGSTHAILMSAGYRVQMFDDINESFRYVESQNRKYDNLCKNECKFEVMEEK